MIRQIGLGSRRLVTHLALLGTACALVVASGCATAVDYDVVGEDGGAVANGGSGAVAGSTPVAGSTSAGSGNTGNTGSAGQGSAGSAAVGGSGATGGSAAAGAPSAGSSNGGSAAGGAASGGSAGQGVAGSSAAGSSNGGSTGGGSCAPAYAQAQCLNLNVGSKVSAAGHNYTCADANCRNCQTHTMCAPGQTGCPWGGVWTDNGTCN